MRSPFRRLPTLALLTVAAVLAGACVRPGPPSVAIDKLEANLVFGVKPAEETTMPPAQQAIAVVDVPVDEFPDFEFPEVPEAEPFVFNPNIRSKDDCPAAALTDAPKKATEATITGEPPLGVFRWQRSLTARDGEDVVSLKDFERRIVRNHRKISDTVYEFQTVQPTLDPGDPNFVVTTFEVKTGAVNLGDPTAGAGVVESPVRPGEPERGVTITSIEMRDRNDNAVGFAFQPTTGILMLPLPVTSGETYQSVAVDPKGASVAHEATVTRRARIDACGELVDGWLVEATQVVAGTGLTAGPGAGSYRYSYIVAPQYGGMLIHERIQPADETDDSFDIEYTLGQVTPEPLPPASE